MVIFRNFEKSAYVPSKKYLHPPPAFKVNLDVIIVNVSGLRNSYMNCYPD